MKYSKIYKCDISNGPGFRVSLFTQGCNHKCHNCFNPETWNTSNGKEWTNEVDKKILKLLEPDYISGLSILGGDPLFYYEDEMYNKYISSNNIYEPDDDKLFQLVKMVKHFYPQKTIWLWTGYLWEDFYRKETNFSSRVENILPYIDIIVDGPFIESLYNMNYKYAGSTNQRVIDVNKSIVQNKIVIYK